VGKTVEIGYRALPLAYGAVFFSGGSAWLFFGPETSGIVGYLTSRHSLSGMTALALGVAMAGLFNFYLVRAAFGLSAVRADDGGLTVSVVPCRSYRYEDLDDVKVEDGYLQVIPKATPVRRVKLELLDECDAAVDQIRTRLLRREQ
jgi:hypothetical protein